MLTEREIEIVKAMIALIDNNKSKKIKILDKKSNPVNQRKGISMSLKINA